MRLKFQKDQVYKFISIDNLLRLVLLICIILTLISLLDSKSQIGFYYQDRTVQQNDVRIDTIPYVTYPEIMISNMAFQDSDDKLKAMFFEVTN